MEEDRIQDKEVEEHGPKEQEQLGEEVEEEESRGKRRR